MKERLYTLVTGIAGSYSQVFFSGSRWLALLLFLSTLIDPAIGLSGLLSVVFAMGASALLGLNPAYVRNGLYTYNVLLTGLAMGANFQPGGAFLLMLALASLLSLFISVWLAGFASRFRLPFLSLPFVIAVWIIFLNARGFQANILTERNVYLCHGAISAAAGRLSLSIEQLGLPKVVILYFKSMASIFFQDKLIAGILISLGLLLSSRIAFFLSWLGFLSGFLFFRFSFGPAVGHDYVYTGFNYIFSAIAIAGFYLVPSVGSYALVIVSVPLIALFNSALLKFMAPYYLPLYSLPFTLAVIMLMAVLNRRFSPRFLDFVQYQQYSPEKNLYAFTTYMERFKKDTLVQVHLPFYGEWRVSQGHNGPITHKEEWRHALDFVVTDEHGKTFKLPGKSLNDFYCFSLPVLAPADGEVVTVEDGIEDNTIGDVNLGKNWGNTIIIRHADHLFSKLSHLKQGSIKVKAGDHVKRGELLAQCGSSGRSPEPHIHFQLQATPYIGAPTLNYPLSYYLVKSGNSHTLHAFDVPKEGELLLRPIATPLLRQAFHFIPGMTLRFEVNNAGKTGIETWEVFTDAYNNSYLHCAATKSSAWFTNNDTLFYFTGFSGSRQSLLYYFYLAAYKVPLCFFPGLEVRDMLPVETSRRHFLKPLQDLAAPFYIFMKPVYSALLSDAEGGHAPRRLCIRSTFSEGEGRREHNITFETELLDNRINRIKITNTTLCIEAKNIG